MTSVLDVVKLYSSILAVCDVPGILVLSKQVICENESVNYL